MKRHVDFCLVIPITHSLAYLRECVESLVRLDYPREEVTAIFVGCGQVSGADSYLKAELAANRFPGMYLELPPRPPSALDWLQEYRMNEARNAAIAACAARYYVFLEDDTSYPADWLQKTVKWVEEQGVGAWGGPDVLPPGLGWLAEALDVLLNSGLGSPGRGIIDENTFIPRKDYLVIPAAVLADLGAFPENLLFGTELQLAAQIRKMGLRIRYMADNPILHRRVTTIARFIRRNVCISSEKVRLLRKQQRFAHSAHAGLLTAACAAAALTAAALVNTWFAALWIISAVLYFLVVGQLSLRTFREKNNIAAALAMLALVPCHHAAVVCGIIDGLLRSRGEAAG